MFVKALGLDFRNILRVCFGNVILSADRHFDTKTSLKRSQARTRCVAICKGDIFMHCYVRLHIHIYIWKIYIYNMYLYLLWLIMTPLHLICDMFQMMKCWTTRPSISEAFAEPRADHRTSPRVEPVQRRRCGRCISLVLRFIPGFAHLEIKHKFKVFCKSWVLISGCVGHVCSMISTFCNEYLVYIF